ncbi:MAG: RNA pseudouridine synthase, partial [Myxococcota bacterium]|nr:RNA pseudouridine synthase [Myxococcota bacterium]
GTSSMDGHDSQHWMNTSTVHHVNGPWKWLVKPAGVPVFPPHADPDGPCVLSWLRSNHPAVAKEFPSGFEDGIAHRLDVSTSGLIVVADTPASLQSLRDSFANGLLTKRYLFVSSKEVPWSEHHVTTPIAHHKTQRRAMTVQRGKNTPHRGKWYPADTRFRRIKGDLWEAIITTGVMHQIRVHAASVGLALAGDRLYGGGTLNNPSAPPNTQFQLHHTEIRGPVTGLPDLACPPLAPPAWWELQ